MSEWKWQVPKYEGSKWHDPTRFSVSGNFFGPTVNVFCEHKTEEVFLFGSFSNSTPATSEPDSNTWIFQDLYLSGDGYSFKLRKSSSDMHQALVGDELVDLTIPIRRIGEEFSVLRESDALNAREQQDQEKKLLEEYKQIVSEPRRKTKFQCPMCGYALVVRHETVQPILNQLWAAGVREISTRGLATLLGR